ncbi:MAG: L-cysteine desulfidase family protein [Planctomycetota bacterium]
MELWINPGIYKNAFGVAIPGAKGAIGIDWAAALGFYGGDPELKLEVLEPIDSDSVEIARNFIESGNVRTNLLKDKEGIYIRSKLTTADETAEAVIEGTHDNLTSLSYNGVPVQDNPLFSSSTKDHSAIHRLEEFLRSRTLAELIALLEDMDEEDYDSVMQGVRYNLELSKHGLDFGDGLAVGKTLELLVEKGLIKKDMILEAKILTSSACDARMSGVKLPAMSSAGSGNHGLTAILPIWAVKDHVNHSDTKDVLKAIALSHIITGYIKSHTGRLSAVCGCSVAAGAGAAAGAAYLMRGDLSRISSAIKNLIGDLAGVICDGAKASCALKLATAAGTAIQSALFSLHGVNVKESDGIIDFTPEQTLRNMGQISTQGMIETDRIVLQIMVEKQFGDYRK